MNRDSELRLKLKYDGKEGEEGIKDTRKTLLDLAKETKGGLSGGVDDSRKKFSELARDVDKVGMSAKATAAALRGVPAQFTDIVTSLQGGQAPLTVLLQQGGQLKDMFGGVGNAAKALGGYVLGLVNPYTIVAAAIATVGFAAYQGISESKALADSLILSGNAAGQSVDSLYKMAAGIESATGASKGAAVEALSQVAATGKVTSGNLSLVAEAAIRMERATGTAVAETVKQFAELGKSPVEATLKLNEQYNYLTASVFQQIKALQDQGKTVEAAGLAQKTYADASKQMTESLTANLGTLGRAWLDISDWSKKAWDSMAGSGNIESEIDSVSKKIAQYTAMGFGDKSIVWSKFFNIDELKEQKSRLQQTQSIQMMEESQSASDKASQRSRIEFQQLQDKYLTKEETLRRAIQEITNKGKAAGTDQKDIDDLIAEANKKYVDKDAASKGKSQLGLDLEKIKADSAAATDIYTSAEKIMQAMRSANNLTDQEYYASKLGFIRLIAGEQERELQAEIRRMQAEKLTGKDKLDNDKSILEAQAKLAKIRTEASVSISVNSIQEVAALKKTAQAHQDATIAAQAYLDTVRSQNERAVGGVGRGDKYNAEQAGRNQIEDKFTTQRQGLERDKRNEKITQDDYDFYLQTARDTYEAELKLYEERTTGIDAAQSNWVNGASKALEDYRDSATNIAGQTAGLFSNAFRSMEDSLVNFVMTGKMDFKSLANSIISDLARIEARKLIATVASSASSALGNLFSTAITPNAAGNVYNSPSLSDYSGTVVSKPTFFAFANGAGMAGEAGPEGIFPLKRGRDGKLGIQASGASGTGSSVVIHQSIQVDSRSDRSSILAAIVQAKESAKAEILASMQRGGAFARA